ncbi:S-layer homology domain-containing protein [Solibacillus silvestris]|uniref:S-layer homology domain-containing protein n=1 Tax=Solibacillus silvestris TaxID=76853 RepID=UPI003F8192BE
MPKFRSALLASLLFISTALPAATYANVEGTVEAENSTVQIPQNTINQNTRSVDNNVVQEELAAGEKDAAQKDASQNPAVVQPEEQISTAKPAQPKAETAPAKPAQPKAETAPAKPAQPKAETAPEKPAQPEAETTPEKPAATEEKQDSSESTEQPTTKPGQNDTTEQPDKEQQTAVHLTVKQKLADVPNNFWAKNEVMQLVEMGVIGGYPDAEFRPNLNINRGQAANLFKGALKLPEAAYQAKFSDVSSKSSFLQGVFSTYNAGIFGGKPDGRFGVSDALTREQMATTLVRAFSLKDTGEELTFKDWNKISESHRENVKILAQHRITTGREDGSFDPKATVNRVTFSVMLHRALVATNKIEKNEYTVQAADVSTNYKLNRTEMNFTQVTSDTNPLYLRSTAPISFKGTSTETYGVAKDTTYNYAVGNQGATVKVTIRTLENGDDFVFTNLTNKGNSNLTVDLFHKATNVTNYRLYRYDRFPIEKNVNDVFGYDSSSYPTGLLRIMSNEKLATDRMVGQAYRSKQLTQSYKDTGGTSYMRDLQTEYEAYSHAWLGEDLFSFYTLASNGNDIIDTWYMDSNERLFKTDENMNGWMLETALNYKKRNNWYTAEGPYNKMATTTEPMPKSYQGFGRNLLLVKEDRALVLYKEQGDRYFANLVKNSFISLDKFKGNEPYWKTEVTSTYLKSLYGITAPFIDTRFNEQIALFYYNSGADFNIPKYKEPLRNYADLLVSRKEAGHVIKVADDAYYISDYFPVNQQVTTHASMNHLLGGMNILLLAYKEFQDPKYVETAASVSRALQLEKNKWIRTNGDIWYRVNAKGEFAGTDYQHLTLEDLINAYKYWKDADPSQLPVFEEMIISKANYLSVNRFGYTMKIKNGLEEIGMSEYLPEGQLYTDAL